MRKVILLLLAAAGLFSCTKEVSFDHNISAEFPAIEDMESISVCFSESGSADILLGSDGSASRGSLSVVRATVADESEIATLLEENFWKDSSRQWIFYLETSLDCEGMGDVGFVNVLRARGLSLEGASLWASANVYDKISAVATGPVSFTVKIWEDE